MLADIQGQVALVTGASRGIGRATAVALAREGCHTALLARSVDGLEQTAAECRNQGIHALSLPTDITDRSALREAVQRCVAELGQLDILVNNAGVFGGGPVHQADLEVWDRAMEVNAHAPMDLTAIALPHMVGSGRGAVIFIASIAGRMSFPSGGAYCASKHAVVGFSGSVFEDVRESGIKVCALCPGYVNTEMVAGRKLATDKMIQPEDVAETVVFICRCPETACPTEIVLRPQRSPYLTAR